MYFDAVWKRDAGEGMSDALPQRNSSMTDRTQ